MGLLLGGILLDGFEVAEPVSFGGAQSLAVHKLPGGTRIIDAMGPDDRVISWHGILSGADASDRARALDAVRVAGNSVFLAWDVFTATVIVSELKLEFCNSWWVPYRIGCTVLVGTQTPATQTAVSDVLGLVLSDLGLAGAAPGVTAALGSVGAAGSTVIGSQGYAAAVLALNAAGSAITSSISQADTSMSAVDLVTLTDTAGMLAQLTGAAGYVGRATVNFVDGFS